MNPHYNIKSGLRRVWVLVAHRAGGRIFSRVGAKQPLKLVEEFDYPQGRLQNREIDTDSKGSRASASGNVGGNGFRGSAQVAHGGTDPQLEAAEHLADIFAHKLAERVKGGRTRNEFDDLVLVADPGFLGKLRLCIDKETQKHVVATLNRNLGSVPSHELPEHLDPVLSEIRQIA